MNRSANSPEPQARNLGRRIMSGLGSNLDGFTEYSTTSELASGIKGAYVVTFRPNGLDRLITRSTIQPLVSCIKAMAR